MTDISDDFTRITAFVLLNTLGMGEMIETHLLLVVILWLFSGPQPAVIRAYLELCVQGSLLVEFRSYDVWGLNPI